MNELERVKGEDEYLSTADRSPFSLLRRLRSMLSDAGQSGSPWAFMRLAGELTESEHNACQWFFELRGRYARAIGAHGVKPVSLELGSKGEPLDPFCEAGERLSRKERAVVEEYRSAELAAIAAGGEMYRQFRIVIVDHHEDDWRPNWAQKAAVKGCSQALAKHRAQSSRHRRGRR